MIFESVLEHALQLFGISDLSVNTEYLSSFSSVLDYLDYLDKIIPVNVLLGCLVFLFLFTLICCIVKAVLMVI